MEGITNKIVNKEQQAQNFENLMYDPLENSGDILFGNSSDPDLHFYNTNVQNQNTPYILPEQLQNFLGNDKDEIYENFKMFLLNLNFSFSIICFSEIWLNDSNVDNSNCDLPNYVNVHQTRNHHKGGGVSVYIHKNFQFKIRNDPSINGKDIESIDVELLYEKRRNTLLNIVYRPPNSKIEPFENFLKIRFNKNKNSNKNYHIGGDFSLNLLDHFRNKKVQDFSNLIYQNGMIPTINKPTRVTEKTATAIDHIITNSFVDNTFKTAIIKSDVSDHFPICIFIPSTNLYTKNDVIYQYKIIINDEKIESFLQNLYQCDWDTIKTHQDANEAYNNFILTFCTIYDTFFRMNKMKIKTKDLESPWITKGIKNLLKRSTVCIQNI